MEQNVQASNDSRGLKMSVNVPSETLPLSENDMTAIDLLEGATLKEIRKSAIKKRCFNDCNGKACVFRN